MRGGLRCRRCAPREVQARCICAHVKVKPIILPLKALRSLRHEIQVAAACARAHTRTCCSATAMTVMPSGNASRQAGSSTCADTPAVMLPCHNTCYAAERTAWLGCCYLPFAECGDVVRFPEGHAGQARARHRLRIPPRQPRRTHRLERRARAPALAHRRALKQPQTRVKQRGGERGHVGRQGDPRQPCCVVQHAALPALALDLAAAGASRDTGRSGGGGSSSSKRRRQQQTQGTRVVSAGASCSGAPL